VPRQGAMAPLSVASLERNKRKVVEIENRNGWIGITGISEKRAKRDDPLFQPAANAVRRRPASAIAALSSTSLQA